jgi:hypothetical protein
MTDVPARSSASREGGWTPDRRWPRWLKVVGSFALVVGGAAALVFVNRDRSLSEMSVLSARVAIGEQSPEALTEVDRAASPDIYYHVVLGHTPLGWPLQLRCEWQDPTGRTAFYNQYRTRIVYASMWPTHCRQHFQPSTPPGEWHVRLLLENRVLSSSAFVVK